MKKILIAVVVVGIVAGLFVYAKRDKSEEGTLENSYHPEEGKSVIYFAGGCFWGTEKLFSQIPGVKDAVSGYANGDAGVVPSYGTIGATNFKETVRVEYDPKEVSLDVLLYAYFAVVDPTVKNRQGNDIGSQYQTGIYYQDETSGEIVKTAAEKEKKKYDKFYVEILPLENFYDAEEYHQDYLDKNPGGYCHIGDIEMDEVLETIRVTQTSGTEKPFSNEFYDDYRKGIYVDKITGEPLFSSTDKYESSCGWPSFSKPITGTQLAEYEDDSHGMNRTEIRSGKGDNHLGHVFENDSESPNGTRYCINSAALRFVPYEDMEKEGYGSLKKYVQ